MQHVIDSPSTIDHLPLAAAVCIVCNDTGVWMDPQGRIVSCPRIPLDPHNQPGPAGEVFRRAARRVASHGQVNAKAFDLGRYLTRFTSEQPCERTRLITQHFSYSSSALRNLHSTVEELRRVWLLPVGSRKDAPAGYWIISEMQDFAAWVERSKAAPITQLTTIHRVAKANFPVFAEQLEIEFWNDIQPVDLPAAA